jgi:hypothetical protein
MKKKSKNAESSGNVAFDFPISAMLPRTFVDDSTIFPVKGWSTGN